MIKENKKAFAVNILSCILFLTFFTCGCSSPEPMALTDKTKSLDVSKESIILMTAKISNQYKPDNQPRAGLWPNFFVRTKEMATKKVCHFSVGGPYHCVDKQFNEYLVSIKLPPGEHQLQSALGVSGYMAPAMGVFVVPVYSKINVEQGKVIYIGHIEATNRKRSNDDELRAGPIFPIFDQVWCGFSDGTWDINIIDNYTDDVALFKQKYPVMVSCDVEKRILPPWKKPTDAEMNN